MSGFVKSLSWVALAMAAVAFGFSYLLPAFKIGAALAGLGLMAVNACAAVGAFYLRLPMEPVRLILVSLAARLPALGAVMVASILILKPEPAATYSFLFAAMAAYLIFQVAEIRHVIRHPEMMRR